MVDSASFGHLNDSIAQRNRQSGAHHGRRDHVHPLCHTDRAGTDGCFLTQELTVEESTVAHITTSAPSRLLLVSDAAEEKGTTAWPSMNGAYLGHAFLPPT